jgi:hypothetical protein
MKRWYAERPDLFIKKPRNHPGPDSYAGIAEMRGVGFVSRCAA